MGTGGLSIGPHGMVYTPGMAEDCRAIADDPSAAGRLTTHGNSVAVVSDGSAVLGLGDIGPRAALPVLEGKAALYKRFARIDAWPLCLDVRDVPEMVRCISAVSAGFGGVNLEDIAAPLLGGGAAAAGSPGRAGIPRRPARHRRRGPRLPGQRAAGARACPGK